MVVSTFIPFHFCCMKLIKFQKVIVHEKYWYIFFLSGNNWLFFTTYARMRRVFRNRVCYQHVCDAWYSNRHLQDHYLHREFLQNSLWIPKKNNHLLIFNRIYSIKKISWTNMRIEIEMKLSDQTTYFIILWSVQLNSSEIWLAFIWQKKKKRKRNRQFKDIKSKLDALEVM